MRTKTISLFFALIISGSIALTAQNIPVLRNINDPLLQNLMKEKKNIRFVKVNTANGPVMQFYEQPGIMPNKGAQQSISHAQMTNFHLTKDINTQTDANPSNNDFINDRPFAIMNSVMYFSANDGIHSAELWRSDGTAAGTYLVKDVSAGSTSSNPHEIIVANNKIFFVTRDFIAFRFQLWVSDGTEAGTVVIRDVGNGPGVNGSYYLTNISGTVYFFNDDLGTLQLWKTDGINIVLVKDFSNIGQSPLQTGTAQGLFYFTVYSSSVGRELWRSDGTVAGTFIVKDISSSFDFFSGPVQLTPFNNKLYFSADDGTGRKLWLTDGTTNGTSPAPGINNVFLPDDISFEFVNTPFTVQGNNFFTQGFTSAAGSELYKYDITAGFSLVKDIVPGPGGGIIDQIIPVNNNIAFQYYDTAKNQYDLWGINGASSKIILIDSFDNSMGNAYLNNLTAGNNLLYFTRATTGYGTELWRTGGTPQTTTLVKDIYTGITSSSPKDLTFFKKKIYFNAASKNSGTELWQTDGTEANTIIIKEINQTATAFSGPNYFDGIAYGGSKGSALNNILFFTATKPETGYELYRSDGTGGGTGLVKDIIKGEFGSGPSSFISKNNLVYFVSVNRSAGVTGLTINKTDSNGNITQIISPVNTFAILNYSVADNGIVFYIFYNYTSSKYELWRSDGTVSGNFRLTDKIAGITYPYPLKTIGNKAYFTVSDSSSGNELWMSDGTVGGTMLVKDILPGNESANPYSLYVFKKNIYFGANDGTGNALWKSDGTPNGTIKLKTVEPYGLNNYAGNYNDCFCAINNTLYFSGYTFNEGWELWKTNGTDAGTILVKDILQGSGGEYPQLLTNVNGSLFFATSPGNRQLWKTDGTDAGTKLIIIFSGLGNTYFNERCVAAGKFFFNEDEELWVSDGIPDGTHHVIDNGLNGVTEVHNLVGAGNNVFFNGYTDQYSYELYTGDATQVITNLSVLNNTSGNEKMKSFTASLLNNPVNAVMNIQVQSSTQQTINLSVSNENGNLMSQQKFLVQKGITKLSANTASWQPGIYLVKLFNTAGDAINLSVMK